MAQIRREHGAGGVVYFAISVARCTGALRLNREIAALGEPQGYMVMEVRGDSLRCYSPEKTSDATVKVRSELPTFSETLI